MPCARAADKKKAAEEAQEEEEEAAQKKEAEAAGPAGEDPALSALRERVELKRTLVVKLHEILRTSDLQVRGSGAWCCAGGGEDSCTRDPQDMQVGGSGVILGGVSVGEWGRQLCARGPQDLGRAGD